MTEQRKAAPAAASTRTENIQVVLRTRPLSDKELERGYSIIDCQSRARQKVVTVSDKVRNVTKTYTFDKVFSVDSKQSEVYESVVEPLLDEVLNGYNCTIFAYGQTGSGKTYTMLGERRGGPLFSWATDPHSGIIPRCLSDLFLRLTRQDLEFWVKVTFVELYNEELYDLLSNNVEESRNIIKLYSEKDEKLVTVKGLQEVGVKNEDEVFAALERGAQRRTTAATYMNEKSSRSHTVFTINLQLKEVEPDGREVLKSSKLNLVDLAGSENVGRSGATGKRLVEAGTINQSLLTLGRVITALVDRQPHVPYRESKLTRILADSLGGRTKTCVIATVSPDVSNLEETLSTLDYAHRAKNIQNKPEVNQTISSGAVIKELAEDCERLRRELDATRRKNGVFVDPNDYDAQVRRLKAQEENIKTLREALDAKKHECEEFADRFTEAQSELEAIRTDFERLREDLEMETRLFDRACEKLAAKRTEARSQRYLLTKHAEAESQLYDESVSVLSAADRAALHCDILQNKVARTRVVDATNIENAQQLVSTVHEREISMAQKLSELSQNVIAKRNELVTFVNASRSELRETIANALPTCSQIEADCSAQVTSLRSSFDAFETQHSDVLREFATDWSTFRNEQTSILNELNSRISEVAPLLNGVAQRSSEHAELIDRKLAVSSTETELDIASLSAIVRDYFEKEDGQNSAFVTEYERIIDYYNAKLHEQMDIQALRERNLLSQARRIVESMRTEHEASLEKVTDDCRVKLAQLRQYYDTFIRSTQQSRGETESFEEAFVSNLKLRVAEQNDALVANQNLTTQRIDELRGDVRTLVTDCRSIGKSISSQFDEFNNLLNDGVETTKELSEKFIVANAAQNGDLATRISDRVARLRTELQAIESALIAGSDQQACALRTLVEHVEEDAVTLRDEIGAVRELIEMYVDSGIHVDPATGATPQRETYTYPRTLPRCRTDDELISEADFDKFLRHNMSYDSFLDGTANNQLEHSAVDDDGTTLESVQSNIQDKDLPLETLATGAKANDEDKTTKLVSRIPKLQTS